MINKIFLILVVITTYHAQSQNIIFTEDFDDESTWSDWTTEDLDGDGETWEFGNAEFEEIDSFTGGFVWSFSWYFQVYTPDNTITSPAINLPENGDLELEFKVAAFDDEEIFQEHYAVYVIPNGTEFTGEENPVFEETLDDHYYYDPKVVNVDITEFAGQEVQLVFRHYQSEDVFYISMDDISITQNTLSIADNDAVRMQVYPNPTSDVINIEGIDSIERLRIFDLQGKLIKEELGAHSINLNDLSNGNYLLNIYTDSQVFTRKIIKK